MSSDDGVTAAPRAERGDQAPIGLRLRDRYRIIDLLGKGSLGDVCLAEDEVTGERVAVRLLPRGMSAEPVQRSRRSIIAASAAHPGFIRVLDTGDAPDGRMFMAVELAEGRRLRDILTEDTRLEIRDGLRLALDLGGAVETLHNLGLAHGGLRPSNVRVLPDGRVKLMDLELAGLRGAHELRQALAEAAPAEYLAPEQLRGEAVTDKTDVYAFALTLYEMLCGGPPFEDASRDAVRTKQIEESPARMRRRRRGIPRKVDALVSHALDKRPEQRPFMSNFLNDLDDAASPPTVSWKRVAATVGGVAVVTAMAAPVAWDMFSPHPDTPPAVSAPPPATPSAPPKAPELPAAPEPSATTTPPAPSPPAAQAPPVPAVAPPAPPAPVPIVRETPPAPPAPAVRVAPPLPTPAAPAPPPRVTAPAARETPPAPVPTVRETPPPSTPPAPVPRVTQSPTPPVVAPPQTPPTPRVPAPSAPATAAQPPAAAITPLPPRPTPTPAPARVSPPATPSRPEAGSTSERPRSSDEPDPNAVIDWLLKRPGNP